MKQEDRVAIGTSHLDASTADGSPGAIDIDDHQREAVSDGLFEEARERVRAAARRERHDDLDGAARIAISVSLFRAPTEHRREKREQHAVEDGGRSGRCTGRRSVTRVQVVANVRFLMHNELPPDQVPRHCVMKPPPRAARN